MKYFFPFIIISVLAFIIVGFFFVGSPDQARKEKFDTLRINHLSSLQWSITEYYQAKKTVPNNLNELSDAVRGIGIPHDPRTGAEYEYRRLENEKFVLCAEFETQGGDPFAEEFSSPYSPKGPFIGVEVWKHSVGKNCFERTIDKDFYKEK